MKVYEAGRQDGKIFSIAYVVHEEHAGQALDIMTVQKASCNSNDGR